MKYASCFCEENIWHLCDSTEISGTQRHVIWISSAQGRCPVYCQQVAPAGEAAWWDYHVILISFTDQWLVWDFDTRLDFPQNLAGYFAQSFKSTHPVEPLFRIIDALDYKQQFKSDRSHMHYQGLWYATPPEWPLIGNGKSHFDEYLDFKSERCGRVVGLEELLVRFSVGQ